jgi:Protein of unknown function (DUF2695)
MTRERGGLADQIAEAERIALQSELPMTIAQVRELFTFLDTRPSCDHTFSDTIAFIRKHKLDEEAVLTWLREHGGHCDCEVIYNVQDKYAERLASLGV